ncbi:MAG: response regulator [Roseiflexaceae bacterium]
MSDQLLVLVADDELAFAGIMADILRDEGYEVECVYDGKSALQACQTRPPALAILDNMLPMMSGADILLALRQQGFQRPIIIMSAFSNGKQLPLDSRSSFLAKPFTIEALLDCVTTHLDH